MRRANATVGLKVPVALPGAQLPGKIIRVAKVRGVESHGMLCSSKDLGFAENAEGLLVLPGDAEVGRNVRELLDLDDQLLTLKPTPNRGDCLSLLGVAREVTAVSGAPLRMPEMKAVRPSVTEKFPVALRASACPRYGAPVRGVTRGATTPYGWSAASAQRIRSSARWCTHQLRDLEPGSLAPFVSPSSRRNRVRFAKAARTHGSMARTRL